MEIKAAALLALNERLYDAGVITEEERNRMEKEIERLVLTTQAESI